MGGSGVEQRFDSSDYRLIAVCLVLIAVSLVVGVPLFYDAFPEAAIDFRITREEARQRAEAFLAGQGLQVAGFRHSAVFTYDDQARIFLERELGLEQARRLIGGQVRLWRWSHRWVRERQKEEFRVELTTAGELVGFLHLIEDERPGARLPVAEARQVAARFLTAVLGVPADSLALVETNTVERLHRTDHTFTWKRPGFEARGATYRYQVTVQGDRVGELAEYLKTPETWQRSWAELRSRNEATQSVANLLVFALIVAMAAALVSSLRRQQVRWRVAAAFGVAAFVLGLLARLNGLPVIAHGFETTETYRSFYIAALLRALFAAIVQGLLVAFLVAAAEPVYRRRHGDQVRLAVLFLPHGLRTKRFVTGSLVGLTLTASFFAYQTVFYLVAERWGAWSPTEIPYDETLSTAIPWVVVLLTGFLPAISEELVFRGFAIPFLQGRLGRRWLALAVPAAIWGLGHAAYPQQPFFIRALELGIVGVAVGAVFLRWGLLPALVWHYNVDALYTALILLRSPNPYYVTTAALSAGLALLPLAGALAVYLGRRFFVDPTVMLNRIDGPGDADLSRRRAEDNTPEAQLLRILPDAPLSRYRPLSRRALRIAAGATGLSLTVFLVPVNLPLDWVDYAVTATAAQTQAATHLRGMGTTPESFETVVWQEERSDPEALRYLLERVSVAEANHLYRQALLPAVWVVRFFRPGQREEYRVTVDPGTGKVDEVTRMLAENTPGASLDEGEARAIAEDRLRLAGLDPESLELVESQSQTLEARRDHRLVWEAPDGDSRNLEELRWRCELRLAGDQPVGLRRYLHVPEAWQRVRQQGSTTRTLCQGLLATLALAALVHLVWLLVRRARGDGIPWPLLLRLGAAVAAVYLLLALNGLPTLKRDYDTEDRPLVFALEQGIEILLATALAGVLVVAALAVISCLYPGWPARLRAAARPTGRRDTIVTTGLALAAVLSADRLLDLLTSRHAGHLAAIPISLPVGLDRWLPLGHGLARALIGSVALPVLAGVALYYARKVNRPPLLPVLAVVALGTLVAGAQAHTAAEFTPSLVRWLAWATLAGGVVLGLLRNNPLTYVLVGFLLPGMRYSIDLMAQTSPDLRWQGIVLLLLLAGLAAWGLRRLGRTDAPAVG
ncbi:MAG: CPBP family intramembrane glutamic endopeptidase [Candidatus Latescibacterota bacterium]|jgi:membrane protease YdiL (CAAX protease family)